MALGRWSAGGLTAAMLAGALGLAALSASDAPDCAEGVPPPQTSRHPTRHIDAGRHGSAGHSGSGTVSIGPTCNLVESAAPASSSYVPQVAAASAADRRLARGLLDGVNEFCRTHTAADITAEWRPGTSNPNGATHYFNPSPGSKGLDPDEPRAALVYGGRLSGVMFTGKPLPRLGSIPRAHSHSPSEPVEMLHVYCAQTLTEAFTPSRLLGVTADLVSLRTTLRPAVMDLGDGRLTRVLAHVRRVADADLPPVEPIRPAASGDAGSMRQAMRTELRRSLMVLDEAQLRAVETLMRQPSDARPATSHGGRSDS